MKNLSEIMLWVLLVGVCSADVVEEVVDDIVSEFVEEFSQHLDEWVEMPDAMEQWEKWRSGLKCSGGLVRGLRTMKHRQIVISDALEVSVGFDSMSVEYASCKYRAWMVGVLNRGMTLILRDPVVTVRVTLDGECGASVLKISLSQLGRIDVAPGCRWLDVATAWVPEAILNSGPLKQKIVEALDNTLLNYALPTIIKEMNHFCESSILPLNLNQSTFIPLED